VVNDTYYEFSFFSYCKVCWIIVSSPICTEDVELCEVFAFFRRYDYVGGQGDCCDQNDGQDAIKLVFFFDRFCVQWVAENIRV